jgi:transcriptional regulator with XRE-family HTH domain
MTIGDKIRTLRKSANLNQTELGERLGVKTNAVSKWECGRVEDIPMSKVKMMASIFNVPVSYLIDDDVDERINISDEDIQFALFGGKDEITAKMYEEVKNFAAYVKQRENYGK